MNTIIAKPHTSSLSFATAASEYSQVLMQRVLAYRWLAEAARDEALKSIYASLWTSVAGTKYAWLEALSHLGFVGLVPPTESELLDALWANAALPPSESGIEALMDWVNDLDQRQAELTAELLKSAELPRYGRIELQRHQNEWHVLRGPLRYLTQYAHQFV